MSPNMTRFISLLVGIIVGFFAYGFFVVLPVGLWTEAQCLRAGYPKVAVTVFLDRYCLTLDGAVTVKVTKP